jgi:hypothetical protein
MWLIRVQESMHIIVILVLTASHHNEMMVIATAQYQTISSF